MVHLWADERQEDIDHATNNFRGGRVTLQSGIGEVVGKYGALRVDLVGDLGSQIHLGAFLGDELISYFSTVPPGLSNLPYASVGRTITRLDHQRQNLSRQLIELWLKTFCTPLLSDDAHTPSSHWVWRKMMCKDPKADFFLWMPSGEQVEITCDEDCVPQPSPWEEERDVRILACPRC